MTDKQMPAIGEELSRKMMAARLTAQELDGQLADIDATARQLIGPLVENGVQVLETGAFFSAIHGLGGNYAGLLAAHEKADKLRRRAGWSIPAAALTRGPGGGR